MLFLKDSLGTSIAFSEPALAVAMKNASLLLFLSPPRSQATGIPCRIVPCQSIPCCLLHSQLALRPPRATLAKEGKDCRRASVPAGFITSTHGGQIHLIFNISYMLKTSAFTAVQGQLTDLTAGFKDKQAGSSHCPTGQLSSIAEQNKSPSVQMGGAHLS